jgi:uncharacterized protein (TIGR00290 family)
MVFTEAYHLKRGYCCKNRCRHCPYGFGKNLSRQKITISWSGGKDSALALHRILSSKTFEVVNLHTVIDENTRRVGLHGVSETLIERQAGEIGIPLEKIYLPSSDDSGAYENHIKKFYQQCAEQGIAGVVFGDIRLQDLREYRILLLKHSGLLAIFPLWGLDSKVILKEFIAAGFKTRICAANASLFSIDQVGIIIDNHFADVLPPWIDPCGENGEFHTFVYDGPLFKKEIPITTGEVVRQTYRYQRLNADGKIENIETAFWFRDLQV